MKLRRLLVIILTFIMLFSITAMTASATEADKSSAEAAATAAPTVAATPTVAPTAAPTQVPDPYSGVGCYMGFFQIQTTSWVYRNDFTVANYAAPEWNIVSTGADPIADANVIKDTVIDGDGEYTISIGNIGLAGSTNFNMVALSTNIPLDSSINITAASLYYGDNLFSDQPIQKNDNRSFKQLMFINQYDNAMKDTVNTIVPQDGTNMIIKFTVEGFGYPSKVVSDTASSEAAVSPVAAATSVPDEAAVPASDAAVSEDGGSGALSTGAIIGIIAGVVIIALVVIIVIKSKKKQK